jgi:hypothetical protein
MKKSNLNKQWLCLNALFLIAILSNGINAEGGKQFGLTGGTKGIGLKYSNFGNHFGVDIGVPIYYKYDKRTGDSVEFNHDFKIDPYFTFSARVYKNERNEFAAGLSLFVTAEYLHKYGNDTVKTKRNLIFASSLAPCLQYMRNNRENEKIFSVELFPLSFFTNKEDLNLSPNIQLNIYLKE